MSSLKHALWISAVLVSTAGAQQVERTRSPHGKLLVPCEACHTATAWKPIRPHPEFNHTTQTAYPLRGMHAGVACQQCHINAVFQKIAHDCAACHADLHRAQMGTHCEQCHTVKGWTPVVHQTVGEHSNRFPLLGAHAKVECESCHAGAATGVFVGMSTECLICHRADLQAATNPNHVTAAFPTDCSQCHNVNAWTSANFNHNLVFPLTGSHATLPCAQCHTGNNFATAPTACSGCHMADYNQTTSPNHAQAAFPTDCSLCHSTINWSGATFNHSTTTFPLTGAHLTVACAQCHVNNNYTTVPTNCSACHLTDYNQTTNPNHQQASFPLDCSLCHSTTNWTSSTFNHSTTTFPLTGAHVTVPCASCHVGGNYTTVPTDCYSCHKADYTGVQNPNHITSGFPTTCATCHNTTSWAGATFNHTWFPIYSGTHANIWTTCADCHLDPSNYNSFSCTNCHTHNEAATDPIHKSVKGYSYTPTACYQCHPQGRG